MIPSVEQIRARLSAHHPLELPPLPGRTNHLKSGVLLPLVWAADRVTCIATVRAATLRKHAGEVCFPGGRPDESDRDLEHTALREAAEELGITGATVLGALSSVPLYTSDYRLVPYVAAVPDAPLTVNRGEVAEVIRVSLGEELQKPHIDGIEWIHEGETSLSPAFTFGEHVMFGATAHSLYELLIVVASCFGTDAPPMKPGRYTWGDVLIDPSIEGEDDA